MELSIDIIELKKYTEVIDNLVRDICMDDAKLVHRNMEKYGESITDISDARFRMLKIATMMAQHLERTMLDVIDSADARLFDSMKDKHSP